MLNIIWPMFIIISFVYAILVGNIQQVNSGIFESAENAVSLTITFIGTICLWNGIMEIVKNTSLMGKLTKLLKPFMKIVFKNLKNESKEAKEISMNIIANMLGLGNAATPLGLKAMKSLQEKNINKDTLTDEMLMFIVLNTASMQVIPTTVIAIRTSLNSIDATKIIFPILFATTCSSIVGIIAVKFIIKKIK